MNPPQYFDYQKVWKPLQSTGSQSDMTQQLNNNTPIDSDMSKTITDIYLITKLRVSFNLLHFERISSEPYVS